MASGAHQVLPFASKWLAPRQARTVPEEPCMGRRGQVRTRSSGERNQSDALVGSTV
jgi:hypothetical protein